MIVYCSQNISKIHILYIHYMYYRNSTIWNVKCTFQKLNFVLLCMIFNCIFRKEHNKKNSLVSKWNEEWRHKRILEKLICRLWSEKKYFFKKYIDISIVEKNSKNSVKSHKFMNLCVFTEFSFFSEETLGPRCILCN